MRPLRRTFRPLAAIVVAITLAAPSSGPVGATTPPALPERLADSTFWRLVTEFSEPSGYFPSENFVSNEVDWQTVIPPLLPVVKPGAAYVGVGPEQNFTYIAAFKPGIAFICDIRRQNLVEHLMYKALIELSRDRVELLSRLWSRPRPAGITSASSPREILDAFRRSAPDSLVYAANLDTVLTTLVVRHGFALSSADSATLRAVFAVFYSDGPDINYSSRSTRGLRPALLGGAASGGLPGGVYIRMTTGAVTNSWILSTDSTGKTVALRDSSGTLVPDPNAPAFPLTLPGGPLFPVPGMASFGALMTETDDAGLNRGWLGSEAAYAAVREMEMKNLIVPVVGDFAGGTALRSVAKWLEQHDTKVGAFYTSNVEQYLYQNGVQDAFYGNVAAMPREPRTTFIRSFDTNFRIGPRSLRRSRLAMGILSVDVVLQAWRDGKLATYAQLANLHVP